MESANPSIYWTIQQYIFSLNNHKGLYGKSLACVVQPPEAHRWTAFWWQCVELKPIRWVLYPITDISIERNILMFSKFILQDPALQRQHCVHPWVQTERRKLPRSLVQTNVKVFFIYFLFGWCYSELVLSVWQGCPVAWLWWWRTSWRWQAGAGWSLWLQCEQPDRVLDPTWASSDSWRSSRIWNWHKWEHRNIYASVKQFCPVMCKFKVRQLWHKQGFFQLNYLSQKYLYELWMYM